MIASIMLAVKVKDHKDNNGSVPKNWCTVWECHTLNAGYVSYAQLKHNQSPH